MIETILQETLTIIDINKSNEDFVGAAATFFDKNDFIIGGITIKPNYEIEFVKSNVNFFSRDKDKPLVYNITFVELKKLFDESSKIKIYPLNRDGFEI